MAGFGCQEESAQASLTLVSNAFAETRCVVERMHSASAAASEAKESAAQTTIPNPSIGLDELH